MSQLFSTSHFWNLKVDKIDTPYWLGQLWTNSKMLHTRSVHCRTYFPANYCPKFYCLVTETRLRELVYGRCMESNPNPLDRHTRVSSIDHRVFIQNNDLKCNIVNFHVL